MPIDLSTARDHPAILLDQRARDHARQEPGGDRDPAFTRGLQGGAEYLRLYERENDVTFVAVPNGGLATIRKQSEALGDTPSSQYGVENHAYRLVRAVRWVFGLGEE